MRLYSSAIQKSGAIRRNEIGRCCFAIFSIVVLALPFLASSVFGDTGGRFILPESDGAPGIAIEDEDASAVCVIDPGWPIVAGEVMSFSLTPIGSGPTGSGQAIIHHPDNPMLDPEIYIFVTVNDNTKNTAVGQMDNLKLMFDLSHDHAVANNSSFDASDDRGIQFNRNGDVLRVFGAITGVTQGASLSDGNACVSENGAASWVMEARLSPVDLGLSNFNDLMGVAVMAEDLNGGSTVRSRWPSTAGTDPTTWANLVTRPPIDYILLIDKSGSMSGDKWASAKQAGNNFRAMLNQLRDDELAGEYTALTLANGGDRIGLAAFTTDETGGAKEYRPLNSVDASPTDYTGVLPATPGGGTPMVAGVNKTFEMFGGAASLGASDHGALKVVRQKVVMLLSDGKHNSPSTTMDFDNIGADFTYLPVVPDCGDSDVVDSLVRINTAAVGSDTTADPDKLSSIKKCFSGGKFDSFYMTTGVDEPELTAALSKFYFQTVYPYYHLNAITDSGGDASVKAGERRLLFFAFWADAGAVTGLSVTRPDAAVASIAPSATVSNADAGDCPSGMGYCYLLFENPEQGDYTDYTASGALANGKFALVDLRVEARFALDNQPHGTSSTITLRGRLREDGRPILNANVRVDVRRPEEGFGTFASTTSLDGCREAPPTLPKIDFTGNIGSDVSSRSIRIFSANLSRKPTSAAGDVNPPAYSLMEALLDECGKEGLKRGDDTGLELYDDGSHGDARADDGIYTLTFDNTSIEGSYVFRFRANGVMSDGRSFARQKEIGEYVRVDVDPGSTESSSRIVHQDGSFILAEYHITPRDIHGGYFGPGRGNQIQFNATGGEWASPVTDYNNGIYSRLLRYDKTKDAPDVSAVIQGRLVQIETEPDAIPCWVYILILIVIVILLLGIILYLHLRKDRGTS